MGCVFQCFHKPRDVLPNPLNEQATTSLQGFSGGAVKKRKRARLVTDSKESNPTLIPFAYGPSLLPDQIRLMKWRDGSPGPKIGIELHTEERGKSGNHALSYIWGNSIRDQEAVCNGQSLMMTWKLQLALSRLRRLQKETYLLIFIRRGDIGTGINIHPQISRVNVHDNNGMFQISQGMPHK
jgi:hypothetical protein